MSTTGDRCEGCRAALSDARDSDRYCAGCLAPSAYWDMRIVAEAVASGSPSTFALRSGSLWLNAYGVIDPTQGLHSANLDRDVTLYRAEVELAVPMTHAVAVVLSEALGAQLVVHPYAERYEAPKAVQR